MRGFLRQLARAVRSLLRSRRYALAVLAILGLAIGVATAVFGLYHDVVLQPLPYAQPDRLVMVWEANVPKGWRETTTSYPNFRDWRQASDAFAALGVLSPWEVNLVGIEQPERLFGVRVSADLFASLGVKPLAGRLFRPDEDRQGAERVVVLGEPLWRRSFGADPQVVGRSITLNGEPYSVIGVMPAGFDFPPPITFNQVTVNEKAALWTVVEPWAASLGRGSRLFLAFGRLRDSSTLAGAERQMEAIAERLAGEYPNTNQGWTIDLNPLHEQVVGTLRRGLALVFGAALLMLLLLATNVASLGLLRAQDRAQQTAVTVALGASRSEVVRGPLLEAVVLAAASGGLGLALASLLQRLILRFVGGQVPRVETLRLGWSSLAFAGGVALVAAFFIGVLPALAAARLGTPDRLKEGGRASSEGRRGRRLRSLLVFAEVAIALALLIAAGLLVRSYLALEAVNPGFATRNALAVDLNLPRQSYREPVQFLNLYRQLESRLAALPGVSGVGLTSILPLSGRNQANGFAIDDRPTPPDVKLNAELRGVSPRYFATMGIQLVAGRAFSEADDRSSPPIAIINQAMAARYWPGENALGKRLTVGSRPGTMRADLGVETSCEIVGIVADVRHFGVQAEAPPTLFVPLLQDPWDTVSVVLAAGGSPRGLEREVRQTLRQLDPDLPIAGVRSLAELLATSTAQPRLRAFLLGAFALLASVVSLLGVYGVVSYAVAQRSYEIALRRALGARDETVLLWVARQGLQPVVLGTLVGVGAAWGLSRLLAGLLFGLGRFDPVSYLALPFLFVLVAALACYLPARRATREAPARLLLRG